jgi:hypothetical protein
VKHVTGRDGIGFLIISNTSQTYVILKNIGRDKNGNTRYEVSLFNATMNVTRYFNLWRMKPGMHAMITNEYGVLDIIKEKFDNINIVEYSGIWI